MGPFFGLARTDTLTKVFEHRSLGGPSLSQLRRLSIASVKQCVCSRHSRRWCSLGIIHYRYKRLDCLACVGSGKFLYLCDYFGPSTGIDSQAGLSSRPLVIKSEGSMAVARTKRVTRRDWTRDDVKELKKHSKGKTPVKTVSRVLKRTPGALRQKAYALGISLGHRNKRK